MIFPQLNLTLILYSTQSTNKQYNFEPETQGSPVLIDTQKPNQILNNNRSYYELLTREQYKNTMPKPTINKSRGEKYRYPENIVIMSESLDKGNTSIRMVSDLPREYYGLWYNKKFKKSYKKIPIKFKKSKLDEQNKLKKLIKKDENYKKNLMELNKKFKIDQELDSKEPNSLNESQSENNSMNSENSFDSLNSNNDNEIKSINELSTLDSKSINDSDNNDLESSSLTDNKEMNDNDKDSEIDNIDDNSEIESIEKLSKNDSDNQENSEVSEKLSKNDSGFQENSEVSEKLSKNDLQNKENLEVSEKLSKNDSYNQENSKMSFTLDDKNKQVIQNKTKSSTKNSLKNKTESSINSRSENISRDEYINDLLIKSNTNENEDKTDLNSNIPKSISNIQANQSENNGHQINRQNRIKEDLSVTSDYDISHKINKLNKNAKKNKKNNHKQVNKSDLDGLETTLIEHTHGYENAKKSDNLKEHFEDKDSMVANDSIKLKNNKNDDSSSVIDDSDLNDLLDQ